MIGETEFGVAPLLWNRLQELRCDTAQGHYVGRPFPAGQFDEWEAQGKRDLESAIDRIDDVEGASADPKGMILQDSQAVAPEREPDVLMKWIVNETVQDLVCADADGDDQRGDQRGDRWQPTSTQRRWLRRADEPLAHDEDEQTTSQCEDRSA